MPFVNVRIVGGHPQATKDRMARRIAEAVAEEASIPKEAVWVVFQDIPAEEWFVGQRSVSEIRKSG
jgi:4-oxalocrotonate tautomerase